MRGPEVVPTFVTVRGAKTARRGLSCLVAWGHRDRNAQRRSDIQQRRPSRRSLRLRVGGRINRSQYFPCYRVLDSDVEWTSFESGTRTFQMVCGRSSLRGRFADRSEGGICRPRTRRITTRSVITSMVQAKCREIYGRPSRASILWNTPSRHPVGWICQRATPRTRANPLILRVIERSSIATEARVRSS